MKKQFITLFLGLMTLTLFAQKAELKLAEKAIKKQQYAAAITSLNSIVGTIESADAKYKAKYYFLNGQALSGTKDYKNAAKSFKMLVDFEKKIGKAKYTSKAAPMLNQIIQEVSARAIKSYENKRYKSATKDFYTTFLLSPTDTTFLYNAAVSASLSKELETSLKYYKELLKIGYTGITIKYMATSKETGEEVDLGSKTQRDLMIKVGEYINPVDKASKSKQAQIVKSIAYILKDQGKTNDAILAIKEARKSNPKDLHLLLTEADLYIQLKDMKKFGELMKAAIAMDPENPTLYFNLGVVNYSEKRMVEAIKYYKKAIELKPDYLDAYMNLAVTILDEEKSIVEEMNKNLSNFKKYDELEARQKGIYKEALPYLEKADGIKRSIDTVRSLLNIYDLLEMDDKSKEYRALYKSMK